MTEAPRVDSLAFTDIEGATAALRGRGLRLSTPRRLVLEALFAAGGPVSAEHIARTAGVDVASVYRNLETLEANGVVRHVHLGHGPGLHTLVGAGEHEYLYCEGCGSVRALLPEELEPVRREIRARFGFEARFAHFAIGGLCERCAGAAAGGGDAPHDLLHSHGDHVHAHPHPHGAAPASA
jgi:Fur family transcriptional regulator, ferric uptake regulator